MARGLAKEIEAEADAVLKYNVRQAADATPRAYHHSTIQNKARRQRSPLRDMVNEKPPRMPYAATPFKKGGKTCIKGTSRYVSDDTRFLRTVPWRGRRVV